MRMPERFRDVFGFEKSHSDLKTDEGRMRLALMAGMRPAARERMGVAMRTKRSASVLSWLGSV